MLIINSVFYHHNTSESVKGKVSTSQIAKITKYLESNKTEKIKIALLHHHPVQHSRLDLGTDDVVENGEKLLDVLAKYSFDIVIHGHKHDPWLRNQITESQRNITIFSSGSFSATSNIIFTSKRNTFHIVEINKNSKEVKGTIATSTFLPKVGWIDKNHDIHGFPPLTGFGYKDSIDKLFLEIKDLVGDRKIVNWSEITNLLPDIYHLTPSQTEELEETLNKNRLIISSRISLKPEIISNPNGK